MLKKALKVFTGYSMVLTGFIAFLPAASMAGKKGFSSWLYVYPFIAFLLMTALIYTDMKVYADKEKRPEYNLKPYPLKGLVTGFIGFSPFIVLTVISVSIHFQNIKAEWAKHIVTNALLGPLYWFIKAGKEAPLYYLLACVIVPVIAMIGYLMGYYGVNVKKPSEEIKLKNNKVSSNK